MYKLQMMLQKIVTFFCVAAAALSFAYSLGVMTDVYFLYKLRAIDISVIGYDSIPGAEVFYEMQPFNQNFTTYSIILIILGALCLVANNHTRRKYYIANYCTTIISSVASIGVAIWGFINVLKYKAQFLNVDFSVLEEIVEFVPEFVLTSNGIDPSNLSGPYSTFWFDACYVVFPILIIAALLNIANLIFKTVLMKNEKQLLAKGE